MAGVRPLSALGPTITAMADAAQRANIATVREATESLRVVVDANGRRFHIKGRRGNRVPLSARKDVQAFAAKQGGTVVTGAVRGIPEGFWAIVEYGSGPHLIASRNRRAGGRRTSMTATFKRYEAGDSLGDLKPLRTPYGPRQFVNHPGHGSIGRPWQQSMTAGVPIVERTLYVEQMKAQVRAFT